LRFRKIIFGVLGIGVIVLILSLARTKDKDVVVVKDAAKIVADTIAKLTDPEKKEEMPDTFVMKDALPREDGSEAKTSESKPDEQEQTQEVEPMQIIHHSTATAEDGSAVEAIVDVEKMVSGATEYSYGKSSGGRSSSGSKSGSSTTFDSETVADTDPETKDITDTESEEETTTAPNPNRIPDKDTIEIPKTLEEYNRLTSAEIVALSNKFNSVEEFNSFVAGLVQANDEEEGVVEGDGYQFLN